MKILKGLGALLTYPEEDLITALPDLAELIASEKLLSQTDKQALNGLLSQLQHTDLLELQEHYVELFDRGRATSLNLFEHVHGESRDRGQAMVDLNRIYAQAGLTLSSNELPDYLPAVLEYLSLRPRAEVLDMLGDCAHILRALGERLRDRDSRYSAIFSALLTVTGEEGLGAKDTTATDHEKSLDEEWADEPVIFGPGAAQGCGKQAQTSVIKFMPGNISRGES